VRLCGKVDSWRLIKKENKKGTVEIRRLFCD